MEFSERHARTTGNFMLSVKTWGCEVYETGQSLAIRSLNIFLSQNEKLKRYLYFDASTPCFLH